MEDNCPNHKDTKERMERIENDLRLITAEIATIKQGAVRTEDSTKASHKRLDGCCAKIEIQEKRGEDILRLAMSIERLAESIKAHNDSINEHEDRLRLVEDGPGKYALKMWHIILGLVITSGVSFIISHFLGA